MHTSQLEKKQRTQKLAGVGWGQGRESRIDAGGVGHKRCTDLVKENKISIQKTYLCQMEQRLK